MASTPDACRASAHHPHTTLLCRPSSTHFSYVGLRNLGCICYMNASNQQFFMVPKFRHSVLQFDDEEEDKRESVMFQLQRLFAYLQESEERAYNPRPFTHALKDMGEPTNVAIQKDASEYLGNLFQQLEVQVCFREGVWACACMRPAHAVV